jgi:hypothetical protein
VRVTVLSESGIHSEKGSEEGSGRGKGRWKVRLDLSTRVSNDYTRERKGNGHDGAKDLSDSTCGAGVLDEIFDKYFDEVVIGWYKDGGVEFGADNVRWVRKWVSRNARGKVGNVKSVVFEIPEEAEEKWKGWMELAVYGRSGRKGGGGVVVVKNAVGTCVNWRTISGSWEVWKIWI